jgi:hypothetical protein
MSTATTTTHHDPVAARRRLADLGAERGQLSARLADLRRRLAAGRTPADVAALSERLIAGEPASVVVEDDLDIQARAIVDQLAVIAKAEDTLNRTVQLDDLRKGSAAALPAFTKAISHIRRLDAALAAVDKVVQEAAADVLAFERLHAAPGGLEDRFPAEPRRYDAQRLLPLRGWPTSDWIEQWSMNASRYARWQAEAKALGDLG